MRQRSNLKLKFSIAGGAKPRKTIKKEKDEDKARFIRLSLQDLRHRHENTAQVDVVKAAVNRIKAFHGEVLGNAKLAFYKELMKADLVTLHEMCVFSSNEAEHRFKQSANLLLKKEMHPLLELRDQCNEVEKYAKQSFESLPQSRKQCFVVG